MALTKSSVLHYWSSRYGINPRVGGRPVFTRNSAGLFTTQEGEVNTAIVNTPRFDWATLNLPNGQTERRKVLTLEPARSNALVAPSDLTNGVWAGSSYSITTGIPDPMGGMNACTLTATGAAGNLFQTQSTSSNIIRVVSGWIRRRTGSGIIYLRNSFPNWIQVPEPIGWQRVLVTGAASIQRQAGYYLADNGDQIDTWLCQLDEAPFATSGIKEGSGASRAADSLYWNFPPVPQAMMLYVRFVEQGTLLGAAIIAAIGGSTPVSPQIQLGSGSGFYFFYIHNGTANVIQYLAAAPAIGDTVELLAVWDGITTTAVLYQSINGAAPTSSATSSGLAPGATWSGARLWLNSAGTQATGASKFAELKIVKYADVTGTTAADRMSELRAFELGPNGDVL